jgi:uncharacterized protein (DUF934 family)
MSVIVTDAGFGPETWTDPLAASGDAPPTARGLDLASDADPSDLAGRLDGVEMIRVAFPSFADGRGFTIARRLRQMGYTGRLRAAGHVLADQYAMARRVGFDEVEISDDLAARQPEAQWRARADFAAHDYQARLQG